jgi:hypothetical protein
MPEKPASGILRWRCSAIRIFLSKDQVRPTSLGHGKENDRVNRHHHGGFPSVESQALGAIVTQRSKMISLFRRACLSSCFPSLHHEQDTAYVYSC